MNQVLKDQSKTSTTRKNPCSNTALKQLYEQRHETGDIKFVVGSAEIPAHRCILAALSPKYKAQFYGLMCETKVINVQKVSPAAFNEFLQFFYLDEVTLTLENIEDVLNLANQSLVDELVAECTRFLTDVIGLDKLVWCFRFAIDYDFPELKEFCVKQIGWNIHSVLQSQDFLNCEREMLLHILDLDSLNCNEMEVFKASIAWAQERCKQSGIDGSNPINLRGVLGEAFTKVRFCSMPIDEFAAIDEQNLGLLTAQESIEVYRIIALKRNASNIKSSIFDVKNSVSRKPVQLSIECSFATGSPISVITPRKMIAIGFCCDTEILLNGFIVCNRIIDDIDVEVCISYDRKIFEHTKKCSGSETEILFNNPIQLKPEKWCFLRIKCDTFEQMSIGWHGFNVMRTAKRNGVTFHMDDYYCNGLKFITRVLFNIVDKPQID